MTKEIGDSTLIDTWAATGTITEPDISKKNQGWTLGERPPFEYMNWLQNTFGQKINHMLSRGVADWDTGTSYAIGATVNHTGSLWVALVANDASEPTGANTNWSEVQNALPKYDGTTQATTSGTSITQAIPAGVTEITVCFDNVQTSGFARFQVQIGTASTLQTTGYDTIYVGFNSSATVDITKDSVNDSLGFYPLSGAVTGIVTLVKIAGTTDKWMATSNAATTAVGDSSSIGSGVVTLSGGLDIVGVNTRLGDTFSSGNIHINWRT